VVTHWLIVLILPILLLALRLALTVELAAETDLAVTVVLYWLVALILFLSSALMDNVFELRKSAAMLMAVHLIFLIAVATVNARQVVHLAQETQLVQPPYVLTVLAVQVVLRLS
jgi:hypothetical protein